MDVGLFFAFRNPPPWRRPAADVYADAIEQARTTSPMTASTLRR